MKFAKNLIDLKYGKRVTDLTFANEISTDKSAVLATAFLAVREGNKMMARAAFGTEICIMEQMYNYITYKYCKKLLFIEYDCTTKVKKVKRGYHPHELIAVLNHLQARASQRMYVATTKQTGLQSAILDSGLQSLYLEESRKLRR